MDYKNILEGTRPFFQGLPIMPLSSPSPSSNTIGPSAQSTLSLPMALPHQNSQQNNPLRMKYEEGLGATLSQMYNTVSPTLRIPASSSSPKTAPSPGDGPRLSSPSPGRDRGEHHLNLRGGSSVNIPPASPASSVLNIPNTNSLSSNTPRNNSGTTSQNSGPGPGFGVRRESPLDLSVKTVRQSADSSTNNNPPEGTSSQSQSVPAGSNCVVNSTGGSGTRSLSSSGASTPNNSGIGGGSNNVSTVIAAVANSTTGRDREKDGGRPPSSHNQQLPPHSQGNSGNITGSSPAHVPPPQSPMGYPPTQSHHLFGVGHYPTSAVLNIPGGGQPSDASKLYNHHYLPQNSYRPQNVQTPQPPTGSHNFQSSVHPNPLPSNSSNQNSSGGQLPTTNTTTTTTNSQSQQQQPSRPSSVIPPYNPAQPTFGLGPYHHHHQQQGGQPQSHHHPYHPHPYASYHIQQPGPGPGQASHPYYSHYGTSSGHLPPPAQPHSSQAPPVHGSSPVTANSQLHTSTPVTNRNANVNHIQRNSESTTHHESQAQPTPPPIPASNYQQSIGSNNNVKASPQHYGHSQVPPTATSSPYAPPYSQYYSSHISTEGPRAHVPSQSVPRPPPPPPPPSSVTQSRQTAYSLPTHPSYPPGHYGNSHPGHPTSSPSAFPNSHHYVPPPMGTRSPHISNQMAQHYYPYLHSTPRPIPPISTNSQQQQLPTGYPYPSHLTGPRPTTPHQQPPPPPQHPPPVSYPPNSIPTPLNVPTPKTGSTPPTPKLPKGGGRGGGTKSGEKRKNLLNLLRNSLETRIHEKQEKEKFQFNHQTWNFHGKKYHNPLPPPQQPPGVSQGTSGGGGSILTGMSHHSNSETTANGSVNGVGGYPGLFGINQRSNFIEGQAAAHGSISPNGENSLNRIRTKAEKKQVFPNLLSQIEQENANKHLQSPFPLQQPPTQTTGDKFKNYNNHSVKTSVFDFQEDEEETKGNLNLSRRSPGHSISPVASLSSIIPPKRRSGSKKFTSKLNKWIPPVGVPEKFTNSKNTTTPIVTNTIGPSKNEITVVPLPSTTSMPAKVQPVEVRIESKRVPALDNMEEFLAACDSFVDDLSANPMTIKSRRGGLWAKLKSNTTSKEGKKRKGRRIRRPSAEVDADFQIEEEEEKSEGEVGEGEREDENSETESELSAADSEITPTHSPSSTIKKTKEGLLGESETEGSKKGQCEETGNAGKRKGSNTRSPRRDTPPPKKKSKRDASWEEVKGRKVGKRTLRQRRTGSLQGKSVSDLDDGLRSSGESEGNESDVSVASFSISSDDTGSLVSDSSSRDSDDSTSSDGGSGSESGRGKSDAELSLDSKGSGKKRKKKGRSSSVKGRSKVRRRSTRNSQKGGEKEGEKERTWRRETRRNNRKLRPTRTCAKGKVKDISGESEEERGSSGEEWIMRGELGKRKREKQRIVYGDGSEFRRPGWEEELIDFKKKLRMPSKLIRVAKPSSLSSTPSGKGKEELESPPIIVSPAKSTKENKSPTKVSPVVEDLEPVQEKDKKVKPKGRSPKKGIKETETEKGKKRESKELKGKRNLKMGEEIVLSSTGTEFCGLSPNKVAVVMVEKSVVKVKGKECPKKSDKVKGPVTETRVSGSTTSPIKEEKEKSLPLLPTPGPAGIKFNKKMSIKSVFGADAPPASTEIPQIPVPPKKTLRRNKFKSGFDYIRKKKKAVSTLDGSTAPPPPKRPKITQEKNMNEEDVVNEFRGWVLNKGLGETVLHRAARLGYPDVAAYTLEHDICSPNCKDNAGYSPLHETCMKGNLEVAKILLAYGANPSQAAPGGIRPLHEACENGHIELVRLLISYGADPLLATYAGQTPLELAEHHKPVKRLLEQHIRDVQGKEEKTWAFRGSGMWSEEVHDNGFDVTADPPHPPESPDIGEDFEFEASELALPPIYVLKEDISYILLQDLINFLGLPKDRILKSHPGAELVELNSNDFLEDVHCRQLFGIKFRLNSSSDLLTLIKYDDVIKKMLNIETLFIK